MGRLTKTEPFWRPPIVQVHYRRGHIRRRWHRQTTSAAIIGVMIVAFATGMLTVWNTSSSGAADNVALNNEPSPQPTSLANATIPLSFQESDLNVVADLLPILIQENRHEPTPAEDKDAVRRQKLKDYLRSYGSPLARDDVALDALLHANNLKMILAISFVESNMCKKQAFHNCSGIGGSNLKHYANFAAWVEDFDSLLEKRYKNLPVEKYIGYYVQPGSQNWVDGVYQVLGEMKHGGIE